MSVQISSANFGEKNYPDLAKHRWIIRTHEGFFLKLNFNYVDIEVDLDTIDVYKIHDNGDEEIVDQVNTAKQLVVEFKQVHIIFRSDCTVNRSGFQASIQAVESKSQLEKLSMESTIFETEASQKPTSKVLTYPNSVLTTNEMTNLKFTYNP